MQLHARRAVGAAPMLALRERASGGGAQEDVCGWAADGTRSLGTAPQSTLQRAAKAKAEATATPSPESSTAAMEHGQSFPNKRVYRRYFVMMEGLRAGVIVPESRDAIRSAVAGTRRRALIFVPLASSAGPSSSALPVAVESADLPLDESVDVPRTRCRIQPRGISYRKYDPIPLQHTSASPQPPQDRRPLAERRVLAVAVFFPSSTSPKDQAR